MVKVKYELSAAERSGAALSWAQKWSVIRLK